MLQYHPQFPERESHVFVENHIQENQGKPPIPFPFSVRTYGGTRLKVLRRLLASRTIAHPFT